MPALAHRHRLRWTVGFFYNLLVEFETDCSTKKSDQALNIKRICWHVSCRFTLAKRPSLPAMLIEGVLCFLNLQFWDWAAFLLATASVGAIAAPCVTGPLSGYIATGFSCTVDGKTLNQFVYHVATSGLPTADQITVTPTTVVKSSTTTGVGFVFAGTFSAVNQPSGQNYDINFNVLETNGTASISGAEVQVTGTGGFTEEFNLNGTTHTVTDTLLHDFPFTPPVSSVSVVDDFNLLNGTVVTSLEKLFDQRVGGGVPEPSSLSILGAVLVAFGWALRRRRA